MKLIQGGLVKTITGGDIENGQILIDGGKIVAVGQNLDVPAGTEIIDAAGCIVTPGFVDAHCHIGMHEEASRWEGNDTNEYSGPVTPESAGRHVCGDEAVRRLRGRHDSQISGGDEDCVRREPQGRLRPERPQDAGYAHGRRGDAARDALQGAALREGDRGGREGRDQDAPVRHEAGSAAAGSPQGNSAQGARSPRGRHPDGDPHREGI